MEKPQKRASDEVKPSQAKLIAQEQREIAQRINNGETIDQAKLARLGEIAVITADLSEERYSNALSGLATEEVVKERIEEILEDETLRPAALLCFDLKGFKQINDDCGHQDGDKFLVVFAKTLKSNVKTNPKGKGKHPESWAIHAVRSKDMPAQISSDSLHAHPHGDEYYAVIHPKEGNDLEVIASEMLRRILIDSASIGDKDVNDISDSDIDKSPLLSLVREYTLHSNLQEFGARVNIAAIGGENKTTEDVLRAADATHGQRVAELTITYSNGKIILTDKIEQERLRQLNDLLIEHGAKDHIATISYAGKLDKSTMHRFFDSFLPYLDDYETRHIIADLTNIGVFDVWAADALINICNKIKMLKDSPLSVISPDGIETLDIFRLVAGNLKVYSDVEQARAKLAPLVAERYANKQKFIEKILSVRSRYESMIIERLGSQQELSLGIKKELIKSKRPIFKRQPSILVRFGLDETTYELAEEDDLTRYAQNIKKDVLPHMLLVLNESSNFSHVSVLGENSFAAIIPSVSGESPEITWRRLILKEISDVGLWGLIGSTPYNEMGLQVGFSVIDGKKFKSVKGVIDNAEVDQEEERFKPESPNGILIKKGHQKSEWYRL